MSDAERKARRERLDGLRREGIDPFPARVEAFSRVAEVRRIHGEKSAEELDANAVAAAVVGRVMSIRSFGKLVFATLRENGCDLQVSARRGDTEADDFARMKALDVGDFARVEGTLWRTRSDELTVAAARVDLLSKGLRPLPEKWSGLRDVETRFRQRYLDLLANETARATALARTRAVREMRAFLDGRDFIEVETPVLQPIYGGAAARPFSTHHNAYGQTLFLRISDELYLKRLIVGGLDRVYEIGRDFRNEGVSRKHNPEFTMMECYQAFADYRDMMDLCRGDDAARRAVALRAVTNLCIRGTRSIFRASPGHGFGSATPSLEACEIDVLERADLAALRAGDRSAGARGARRAHLGEAGRRTC